MKTINASLRQGLNQDVGQHPEVLRALVQWLQQRQGCPVFDRRLKECGFAEHLTSWISSGPNRSLTASDVSRALDEPHHASWDGKPGLLDKRATHCWTSISASP